VCKNKHYIVVKLSKVKEGAERRYASAEAGGGAPGSGSICGTSCAYRFHNFFIFKEFFMVKRLFMVATFALLTAGAYAQVTISGGFALSGTNDIKLDGKSMDISGDVGLGGNIYFDYLLPISIPMSLGFEIGVDRAVLKSDSTTEVLSAFPLLLRVAYHFDLLSQLDLYLVGKIGYAIGEFTLSQIDNIGGLAIGIDAGAAYYFTPVFGIFGEVGFDSYMLEAKVFGQKLTAPFNRFLTAGISLKF
jgi:hypothetical protein